MRKICAALIIFIIPFLSPNLPAQEVGLPSSVVPEGLGVNIHFAGTRLREVKQLASIGVKWIRMDLSWDQTEKKKGIYDFSQWSELLTSLESFGIRAIFILDYGNPLYDNFRAPYTSEGRQAFVRWAVAAAKQFKGKGILWEMWNEPNNHGFWAPKPNTGDYIKLALEVGKAFQREVPGEILMGPASAEFPWKFFKKCFQSGLLEYFSAITVHPYRYHKPPETVSSDYTRLRKLIKKYSGGRFPPPIYSGEWGYPSIKWGLNEKKQAQYLARMWLINLANNIPLSIWYDWHDDGPDPKNHQHHFGLVKYPERPEPSPKYEPKPAFFAAQTLIKTLGGYEFQQRLPLGRNRDYVLLFTKGQQKVLAAWTSSKKRGRVRLPLPPKEYNIVEMLGETNKLRPNIQKQLMLSLDQSPKYILID